MDRGRCSGDKYLINSHAFLGQVAIRRNPGFQKQWLDTVIIARPCFGAAEGRPLQPMSPDGANIDPPA